MFRLESASEVVRETTPPLVTEAFALLTRFGDVAFLVVILSILYWLFDRELAGTVIAYALVGLTVTFLLKELFALPRPPAPVREIPVDAGSYGFPSGHALASTVVYGGLLLVGERVRESRLTVSVIALVVLVGLSRVVIGVHYLGDVLAGFAVGGVVLASLWTTVGRRADLASLVAVVLSLLFVAISGGNPDSLFALGASMGAVLSFRSVDWSTLPEPSGHTEAAGLVALGLAAAGGFYWLATTLTLLPVVLVASGLFVVSVVLGPAVLRWSPVSAPRRSDLG